VPEGDTIHRVAARLRPALQGKQLVVFQATRTAKPWPQPGERIEVVHARGKHLLMGFSGGLTLRTHMRMSGSWHLYRDRERWQRPRYQARCLVAVEGWQAVCFNAPVVELRRTAPTEVDELAHLGPDLTTRDADVDECLRRLDALVAPETPIKVALLDQRVACGVGNVYASEVPFAERVHPATTVAQLDVATRRRLLAKANELLTANLQGGPRTTVPGVPGGLAVYGRSGRPCRRCGTIVQTRRLGEHARSTYWCPRCQPEVAAA
jgi:endonuclease-8